MTYSWLYGFQVYELRTGIAHWVRRAIVRELPQLNSSKECVWRRCQELIMYNARDNHQDIAMQEQTNPFPTAQHDHDDCVASAMLAAEQLCWDRGLRFTALRRRVLALVWESHKPVGAYEILASLAEEGRNSAPPTVYRALGFLIEAGLVHRLNMLNAFIGCPEPDRPHSSQFLICRQCGTVAELDDTRIESLVRERAGSLGFTTANQVVEIDGTCRDCGPDS